MSLLLFIVVNFSSQVVLVWRFRRAGAGACPRASPYNLNSMRRLRFEDMIAVAVKPEEGNNMLSDIIVMKGSILFICQ